jgi:D-3-phosphoglycerate dehydrogenase / 2-oxoglutarate reductase
MTKKVLLLDGVDEICANIFKQRGFDVSDSPKLTGEELDKVIGDFDAMVVRSATKVTRELLAKAKKMQVVGRAGVGIDNIDLGAATQMGVLVMNTPDGNTISTAAFWIRGRSSPTCRRTRKSRRCA